MEEHGEYWEKTQTHKMDSGGARKSADGARAGAIEKCEGVRKEGRTEGMRLQGAGKKGAGGNRMVETERKGNVARSPAGLPCVGSSCKAYTRQNMEPNRESQRVGSSGRRRWEESLVGFATAADAWRLRLRREQMSEHSEGEVSRSR